MSSISSQPLENTNQKSVSSKKAWKLIDIYCQEFELSKDLMLTRLPSSLVSTLPSPKDLIYSTAFSNISTWCNLSCPLLLGTKLFNCSKQTFILSLLRFSITECACFLFSNLDSLDLVMMVGKLWCGHFYRDPNTISD